MKEIIVTGIFTIAAAIVGGLFALLGMRSKEHSKQMKSTIRKLQTELLDIYKDVLELRKSEESLIQRCGISKIEARKEVNISKKSEPARVSQRIRELEDKLK